MKKIVTIRAITFRSPMRIPACAIKNVSISALRGSLDVPNPLLKKNGDIRSLPKACMIRGAPKILPRADERVAPRIPAITS